MFEWSDSNYCDKFCSNSRPYPNINLPVLQSGEQEKYGFFLYETANAIPRGKLSNHRDNMMTKIHISEFHKFPFYLFIGIIPNISFFSKRMCNTGELILSQVILLSSVNTWLCIKRRMVLCWYSCIPLCMTASVCSLKVQDWMSHAGARLRSLAEWNKKTKRDWGTEEKTWCFKWKFQTP